MYDQRQTKVGDIIIVAARIAYKNAVKTARQAMLDAKKTARMNLATAKAGIKAKCQPAK